MVNAQYNNFFIKSILLITIIWISWSIFVNLYKNSSGENAYHAANKYFSDGLYSNALYAYHQALAEKPNFIPAKRGLARSLMQLNRNDEALQIFNEVIELEPKCGTSYANRGILYDRMQSYASAIADYKKALQLDPKLAEGPSFLTRFFRNQSRKPSTVADRLHYLQNELKKPKSSQVLKINERDDVQKPYKY